MKLNENIRALRKERSLTQEQLANAVGVSALAVSKWESDNSVPDGALLEPIADALGVSLDRLLGRERVFTEDVMSAVRFLIKEKNRDMELVLQLCWQIELAMYGGVVNGFSPGFGYDDQHNPSTIIDNDGFTLFSPYKKMPFFAIFKNGIFANETNFKNAILENDVKHDEIFAALADKDTYKCLFWLMKQENNINFEPEYMCKVNDIKLGRENEIIKNLETLRTIFVNRVNIDGTMRFLFNSRINDGYVVLAIIAITDILARNWDGYNFQRSERIIRLLNNKIQKMILYKKSSLWGFFIFFFKILIST